MKFKKATATGLLLIGMGSASLAAAPPPLDRPTPPPCCADGHCYPNPLTFGWYETRWRRWPVECMEPIPAGQMGPTAQPESTEIPRFELPEAKDEDRKAPPPSAPRAEEQPIKAPLTAPPGPGGATPPGPGGASPQTAPMTPPGETKKPGGPLGTPPPYEPKVLGPKPLSMNNAGPMDDLDPPPALPFGPRPNNNTPPVRAVQQRPVTPVRQPASTTGSAPSDDPPPSLPVALASWSN